jgi:hypothetical protein
MDWRRALEVLASARGVSTEALPLALAVSPRRVNREEHSPAALAELTSRIVDAATS